MKKILFAASEVVPFIKTGGLADVAGSLPKYFDAEEYDVRIILPKYACMNSAYANDLERILECQVDLNWRSQYAGVMTTKINGITCYLIDNEYYFAGPAPYDNIYLDAEKFAFFSKAVLTVLPMLDFCPDLIHTHDWQTGLIPVFLHAQFRQDPFYRYIRTVHTIHNMKFQGRWYIDAVKDITGLPDEYFSYDKLESYGKANLLKGGLVFADAITTVSQTYAEEIQSTGGGEGLDGLMRARDDVLYGICNGIDYHEFDPANDSLIYARYDGDIKAFKAVNKRRLQEEHDLIVDENAFLIGMVSRLTDQKGFDLLEYIKEEIMEIPGVQMIVLGTGESGYEAMLKDMAERYKGRVSTFITYSEMIAHRIYAGCDAFLMPSLFEPCGLSQMMSLRYGTVPCVRETGGLKDTVEAYNEFEHTGTGFSFHNYNAHEMLYMIRYANKIFRDAPDEWEEIIRRGMACDYSWNHSAGEYSILYTRLIDEAAAWKEAEAKRAEEERIRLEEEEKKRLEEEKKQKAAKKKTTKKKPAKTAQEKTAATRKKTETTAAKKTEQTASSGKKKTTT